MGKRIISIIIAGAATIAMADGAKLFKKCAICHGEKGEKQSLNVSEVIAGWKAEKVEKILHEYKDKKRDVYGFGSMMGGQATKFNDEQMKEVAKYVESLGK